MLDSPVRLTAYASGGGCATKIAQADLAAILAGVPLPVDDPALLVGAATGDDAAVYRLRDDLALVLTTDFFAPVVDDPDDYGAIAAANALSDVYAMGGAPLLALNLVAWPQEDVLPASVLERVLRAGAATVAEAGALVPGGSRRNRAYADGWTGWAPGVTELQRTVVTDAQTSGGLLLAVDPERRDELCERLRGSGGAAAAVGRLVAGPAGRVEVATGSE